MELARKGRLARSRSERAPRFKLDILQDIPEGEPISYIERRLHRPLRRAARDAHRQHRRVQAHHVASAYYKGDEKNPQLQRIYGTAFKNKTELDEYFKMLEEAKKRDHRKIGAEMGLFAIDAEYVGPGLPLWLPKGTVLVEELEKLAKETEFAAGYVRVKTPHSPRRRCI